jgi:predicted MPP superfamily phosphohydrolase
MRILTLSDLHMDHLPNWKMPSEWPDFDVAVFAGDIKGSPSDGMRWLRTVPGLEDCEIVYIAGNHEYYGREIDKEEERAVEAALQTRVHFLNASAVPVIDGIRFVGATLWTDYELYGDRAAAMLAAGNSMNDHRLIRKKWDGSTAKFLPRDALQRHQRERAWLEEQLATDHAGPTVVVTHHAVGHGSVHPRFAGDPVTPAFSSDMTSLMEKYRCDLWLHGHTHDGFDYTVGSTRVVCNPKGYGPRSGMIGPENPLFHPSMVVEVPHVAPEPVRHD